MLPGRFWIYSKTTRHFRQNNSSVSATCPGRDNESRYNRSLKELWSRGLIVAYGEVDEGAFPSLAIGATRVIFEELWDDAAKLSSEHAQSRMRSALAEHEPF